MLSTSKQDKKIFLVSKKSLISFIDTSPVLFISMHLKASLALKIGLRDNLYLIYSATPSTYKWALNKAVKAHPVAWEKISSLRKWLIFVWVPLLFSKQLI
jgi:hypothetical protein